MVTNMDLTDTFKVVVDTPSAWWTISLINEMLAKANIKAKFTTEQQNVYFDHKEGEIITLTIIHHER